MNRRKFFKFLGQATVASGIALVAGLPEVEEVIDDSELYKSGTVPIASGLSTEKIARWDGPTWSSLGRPIDIQVSELYIDANGILYAGGNLG